MHKEKIYIVSFLIFSCMILIGSIIFLNHSKNSFLEIKKIEENNIEFAIYVNDTKETAIPEKDSGYSLDTSKSQCNNGVRITWNDAIWRAELSNISTTKTKCDLYFKEIYKEKILNGAIPDLGNGKLVPVEISADEKPSDVTLTNITSVGGKVTKADITKEWYKYGEKKWANAVILRDGVVDHYNPGDEILESDIESYFVWIPRYRYQLQDSETVFNQYSLVNALGDVKDINDFYSREGVINKENMPFEIIFETKENEIKVTTNQNEYMTHPAFVTFDSNGMWVGKFESGYNQNSDNQNVTFTSSWSIAGAQKNEENSSKVIIKPNVYSWRSIEVADAFYTSYEYLREFESHMMKNMEWGAVTYLTQSKYGRCNAANGDCTEVRINNSESYITGMSAKSDPTCGYTLTNESCNRYEKTGLSSNGTYINSYYDIHSQVGSTTGNYYGIYDMSGGAWEYVMGVMKVSTTDATPTSGKDTDNNSGFNGPYSGVQDENKDGKPWPSNKYYDLYDYSASNQQYQRGHLGDGTKETGPFYSVKYPTTDGTGPVRLIGSYNADLSHFLYSGSPWFARGGNYTSGTDAGIFASNYYYGSKGSSHSFRIILTP